jgi:hypothetical protein
MDPSSRLFNNAVGDWMKKVSSQKSWLKKKSRKKTLIVQRAYTGFPIYVQSTIYAYTRFQI